MSAKVWLGVYFIGTSLRVPATTFTTPEGAAQLFEAGLGAYSKSGKNFILNRTKDELPPTAQSLIMGPDVTEGAAMGGMCQVLAWAYQPGAVVSRVAAGDWQKAA